MKKLNFEFKAKTSQLAVLEQKLQLLNPIFKGVDEQVDTYFKVAKGRLKLREGSIEQALIYYERVDIAAAKQSNIILYKHQIDPALKAILTHLHGVQVVVHKKRSIYFMDNVKFHFDQVTHLGTFVEVEAISKDGNIPLTKLQEQCAYYFDFFGLQKSDYIDQSYSDLLLELDTY